MNTRRGIFWASVTYIFWGITPLYWKLLKEFPAQDLVAHRIIWSALFLFPIYLRDTSRQELGQLLQQWRNGLVVLIFAALLIGCNWYIYVLAIISGRVLDSSLGYFMTPLMSVMVGLILLRERLNRLQTIAVGIALLGVGLFTARLGRLPSLALLLSSSFAMYGYFQKTVKAGGAVSVSVETLLLTPLALGYLFHRGWGQHSMETWLLLLASGPLTAVPMVWYTWAVQRVPYSIVGFLQYLSPVIQFGLALYLYHEPFGMAQKAIFILIWIALALFSFDLWRRLSLKGSGAV